MLDALVERKEHVPFRDSVLTKLLADALTGNSMTTIITTTSPAMRNAAESKSTLAYGARARKIKTKPVVNDSDEKWRVRELEAEVQRLKALAAAGSSSAPGGGGGGAKVVYRDRGKSGGMYAMMMRMMTMTMMMPMIVTRLTTVRCAYAGGGQAGGEPTSLGRGGCGAVGTATQYACVRCPGGRGGDGDAAGGAPGRGARAGRR